MAKDKGTDAGAPEKARPRTVTVINGHTASLVLTLKGSLVSVELKPGKNEVDAEFWEKAKQKPGVQAWLSLRKVQGQDLPPLLEEG